MLVVRNCSLWDIFMKFKRLQLDIIALCSAGNASQAATNLYQVDIYI